MFGIQIKNGRHQRFFFFFSLVGRLVGWLLLSQYLFPLINDLKPILCILRTFIETGAHFGILKYSITITFPHMTFFFINKENVMYSMRQISWGLKLNSTSSHFGYQKSAQHVQNVVRAEKCVLNRTVFLVHFIYDSH